jgi:hypothetical protein
VFTRTAARRAVTALLLPVVALAAGCSSPRPAAVAHGSPPPSAMQGMDDMDMNLVAPVTVAEAAPLGTGLGADYGGYVYLPSAASVPANTPSEFSFHITGPDDHALTRYQPYESKLVVFYLIRSDLTGYRELDPTMREDGTWFVPLPALPPGTYRTYVTFAAPDASQGTPLLYALSRPLTVPGRAAAAAVPASGTTTTATADGYALTLSAQPEAGTRIPLFLDITKDGKPVDYFERYLDGYAHLSAFRVGDGAFVHVLSTGRDGGPNASGPLTAQALFPERGSWRVFVQFEIGDRLHTAAFTLNVP